MSATLAKRSEQTEAWARRAADTVEASGTIACRMCGRDALIDETVTLWRNGALVFAICDHCAAQHEIVMKPVQDGTEVRASRVGPLVISGPPVIT